MATASNRQLGLLASTRHEMNEGLHLVPEHLRDGLQRYVLEGGRVGQFLTALVENDLRTAIGYGDDQSLAGLKGLVQFLHNFCPARCWGSPAARAAWQDRGGVKGMGDV